jgi:hypothetical protein
VNHPISALRRAATLASSMLVVLAMLAACSGNVGEAPSTTPTGPIVISPSEATLFSDLPTTFVVTGGNGSYILTSSNQAVVPLAGLFTGGNTFTVVPGPVAADTPVILTVRDTGTAAAATATLTVRPRTISNVVTITPSSSQSAACGTAVCSGGDAEVKVVLAQNGVPLVGRQVRFDVISGDVRIITSPAGVPETLGTSGTTTTDDTGTARMRIRVMADATSQTALLQVTDTNSGFTQRTSVTIAPSSNAPLNAQPSTIVFQGTAPETCANGVAADVIVFGGRPPYLISQPGSFAVSPTVVTNSGGRFTVTATGQCSAGSQIAVVDGNGATVSVTASNRLSDVPAPTPTPTPTPTPISATPNPVTLNSCSAVANVNLTGGSGTYFATSGNPSVRATTNGSTGSIFRDPNSPNPGTTAVTVTFSDGTRTTNVLVNLTGEASGQCPAQSLTISPETVELTSCTDVANVSVTGGSGEYQISARSTGLDIGGFSNFFSVRRRSSSGPVLSPAFVDVSDGRTVRTLRVNLTSPADGPC